MEFSNKKLQKAFEYFENGKYKEALKLCSKVLNKEYNNEEALTLEGEILYKSDRIDDAIITWKINAEYNKNALAQRHLDSLDTNVKQMALSYTSIYSENEEYRRLVIDAYKESTKKDNKNVKDDANATVDTTKTESSNKSDSITEKNTEINEVKAKPIKEELNESLQTKEKIAPKESTTPEVVEINKEPLVSESKEVKKEEPSVSESVKVSEPKKVKEEKTSVSEPVKVSEPKEVKKEKPSISEPVKASEPKEVKKEKTSVSEPVKVSEPKEVKKEKASVSEPIKVSEPKEVKKEEPSVSNSTDAKKEDSQAENTQFEKISVANRRSSSVNRKNTFNKKIIAVIVAVIVVVAAGVLIYKSSSSTSSKPKTEATKPAPEAPKIDWNSFNSDMKNAINSQNYNEIYTLLDKAPQNEVPQAESAEYQAGLQAMQDNGIEYFYNQGMTAYNNKQYSQAVDLFTKGLKYANGNYLAPHLTYYIGASYSGLDNHDKAVEYYKLYLKNFPNANIYNSGCLYILAKYYYSQGHVKEAQQYAQELQNQFPNSPYNNNDIANILANK
ncbi:tetratricopeptide repeat protein [uncultured Clostridium sp.]|uniref:tetratricopeptide repeat protein n=1 Tax=uncultured Clostridium sp. TaxID=59620 RepID=UPI0026180D92|nr:tetratricopeptide repeat protein [uncultured Clostridium sp.]